MAPAVQPTNALPSGERMSCLIIDYMRFPVWPVPDEVNAPALVCSRPKSINRKEAPDRPASGGYQTSMIDRLNDQPIAARLGQRSHGQCRAIRPAFETDQ